MILPKGHCVIGIDLRAGQRFVFEGYAGMPLNVSRIIRTLPSASRPYTVR
jgi:hypothetical protein